MNNSDSKKPKKPRNEWIYTETTGLEKGYDSNRNLEHYGAESWPITSKIQSKITAVEMKFLRGVKNITKRDRIRNTSIREELKQPELFQNIEKKQLQWYGHVTRMEENRIPKRVHEARPFGNRPQHTWIQKIELYCNKRNKTITEVNKIAKDRTKLSYPNI